MINHICACLLAFHLVFYFDRTFDVLLRLLYRCVLYCFKRTEAQPGAENESPRADGAGHLVENEAAPEAGVEGGNHWWGIVKEIQMIVFGFITSLLPGFHNMDHA